MENQQVSSRSFSRAVLLFISPMTFLMPSYNRLLSPVSVTCWMLLQSPRQKFLSTLLGGYLNNLTSFSQVFDLAQVNMRLYSSFITVELLSLKFQFAAEKSVLCHNLRFGRIGYVRYLSNMYILSIPSPDDASVWTEGISMIFFF